VGSPFNWDAAYDILLQELDSVDQGHFYVLRSSGHLTKSKDIAYADDLLSGMSSLTSLQLKVNIVSAFAIIFASTFLHLPSGNPSDPGNLFTHTTGWVGQQITVATKGVLKVLRNKYDISSKIIHTTQYKESLLRATKSCNVLMRARGDPGNKRMVLRCLVSFFLKKLTLRIYKKNQFIQFTNSF